MPGHLEKRSKNTWTIVIEAGKDPRTGKRKRIKRAFKGSKREAEKEMARLLLELEQGTYTDPSKMTVGAWLDTWLNEYMKPHLRPTTWDSYETLTRRHIKPSIGNLLLKDLRPSTCSTFTMKS